MKTYYHYLLRVVIGVFFSFFIISCEEEGETETGPLPELGDVIIDNISGNSISISGAVVDDKSIDVIETGFIWGRVDDFDRQYHEGHVMSNESSNMFSEEIEGFLSLTSYYICSFASNKNGTAYSSKRSFITEKLWSEKGSFTDERDGTEYEWVKIGEQVWMAENFRYMPFVCDQSTDGIWVYNKYTTDVNQAKNDPNYIKYGCLYDYETAITLAPDGWHLPALSEWEELISFAGGEEFAGIALKKTGNQFWSNRDGNDASGFGAIPGGELTNQFRNIGAICVFRSSDTYIGNEGSAIMIYMSDHSDYVRDYAVSKAYGFSVRYIKDN